MHSSLFRTMMGFLVAAVFASSCEEEMGPDSDGFTPDPDRSSAENLLTNWFETVYSRQDSVLYEQMLDDEYQFCFLPEDADSLRDILGQSNCWGKPLELAATGALFRSPVIKDITLDINIYANDAYEHAGCNGCREIETVITLRVGTNETTAGTPRVLAVDSPQLFIVKPDPADTTLWVVWRQFDQPQGFKWATELERAAATEGKSWGQIKGLFSKF